MGNKVLVVYVEELWGRLLNKWLISRGCSVGVANDGTEGLTKFRRDQFDLVICGKLLSMTGIDLLRAIRKTVGVPPVTVGLTPVIVVANLRGFYGEVFSNSFIGDFSMEEVRSLVKKVLKLEN